MIKYVEFSRYDEFGEHITPINTIGGLEKVASNTKYSSAIMNYIDTLSKRDDKYYVVMNAVGSVEYWGMNSNGDIFPDAALSHMSLPSDASSKEDYGYKTFEYYGKFYKHHANKNPKNSFGEVLFSYWNKDIHRIELVVAIDRFKSKDTVNKLEAGEDIGVSMGCKVSHDICSICGNKRSKKGDECKHVKYHAREVVDQNTAREWSRELGITILPGAQVGMINERPKFFDISEVDIPADAIAHILGKVASQGQVVLSTTVADVVGVTDSDFDNYAGLLKKSNLVKNINESGRTSNSPDGIMYSPQKIKKIKEWVNEKVKEQITSEPDIPNEILDNVTNTFGPISLISSLFNSNVAIRPHEFQRIMLVGSGQKHLADALDSRNINFSNVGLEPDKAVDFPMGELEESILPFIKKYILMRSSHPSLLNTPSRIRSITIVKTAQGNVTQQQLTATDMAVAQSSAPVLLGLAALYMGLKSLVSKRTMKDIITSGINSHGMKTLLGGAALASVANTNESSPYYSAMMTPAINYEETLEPTLLSGHMIKSAGVNPIVEGLKGAVVIGGITLPLAHLIHSYDKSSIETTGRPAGTFAHSLDTVTTPLATGALGGATMGLLSKLRKK